MDEPLRELDRSARPPGLLSQTADDAPGAYEVPAFVAEVHQEKPGLGADVEGVRIRVGRGEVPGARARELEDGLVRERHGHRLVLGMRHHPDGTGARVAFLEVTQEAVADSEELVRQIAGDTDVDTRLESMPEVPKILGHDHQP